MFTILIYMLFCAIMFLFMSHPLSLSLILLIQTMLIASYTGMMNQNYWFSYILFLIMIGGMLILFIYMTSIASNEKFKISMKSFSIISILILTIMIMSMTDQYLLNLNMNIMEMSQQFNKTHFNKNLSKYLTYPMNMITYIIMIYLFITLIMTTKMSNMSKGPLRQKN